MPVRNIFKESNMSMDNVSVEYLIIMWKVLIFEIRVPLLGFRLFKKNETFWNETTCSISTKPWFIYRIQNVYDRVLLSEQS